ncbi:fibronectin type III domain-containing protein [Dyadobacter crusticola]|uniref:fibronectin type III domain-containing protein n=1 Tax=Dyadobacter crusticola TaxID=292407 RepID=UPI00068DE5E4|nr:fibronectin type III domain-containing protein [Dyadobacter crusticola]
MRKLVLPGCFAALLLTLAGLAVAVNASAFAIPKAPSNLTSVAVSPSQINLSWTDNSADEITFELESATDGVKYTKIADLKSNAVNYIHDSLTAATKYWYRLRAKNANGYSVYSNVASATTLPPVVTVPKPPSALVATPVSGYQINLAWTDNANNETAFEVESSIDGVKFEKIADVAANTLIYQHTGLKPATRYWYRVLAKNTAGKSAYTSIVLAVTLQVAPAAPDSLTGTAISQTQINLAWADRSDNETGYQLERSTNGSTFTKIADLSANVTTYQNTGLIAGTLYYYRVRAVNAAGASPYSGAISVRTFNIPVPDRPADFNAVPLAPQIVQLRWTPVTGNAVSVVIERAMAADENFVQIGTVPAAVSQFQDTSKLEKVDYFYRIKAVNAGGSSPYSLISIVRAGSIITGTKDPQVENSIYTFGRTLVVNARLTGKCRISVFDISGRKQKEVTTLIPTEINLNGLFAGIYIVVIEGGKEVISRRIWLY